MGKARWCLLGDPGWMDRPSCGPDDVLCGVVSKCGVVCGGGTRVMWRGARLGAVWRDGASSLRRFR
jgi:hypothetical protein